MTNTETDITEIETEERTQQLQCPACDTYFTHTITYSRPPTYCSKECRTKFKTKKRYCPTCHNAFTCQVPSEVFCSELCKANCTNRLRNGSRTTNTCKLVGCGKPLPITAPNQRRPHFCSVTCLLTYLEDHPIHIPCSTPGCPNPRKRQDDALRLPQLYCSQECREQTTGYAPPIRYKIGTKKMAQWRLIQPHNTAFTVYNQVDRRTPYDQLSQLLKDDLHAAGWTPEDYATFPGLYSPMLIRQVNELPLPDDYRISDFEYEITPYQRDQIQKELHGDAEGEEEI